MHIELVDQLRCIREHADSALVSVIDRREGRYIAEGSLGCPVCSSRYPVVDFIADFRDDRAAPTATGHAERVEEEAILRAAAMLDARIPGGRYLLAGEWGRLAQGLAVSYDVQCVVINPPSSVRPAEGVSILLVGERIPLARASIYGAALDANATRSGLHEGVLALVRGGGRIVLPAGLPLPAGTRALVEDERWRVSERVAIEPPLMPIGRAPR